MRESSEHGGVENVAKPPTGSRGGESTVRQRVDQTSQELAEVRKCKIGDVVVHLVVGNCGTCRCRCGKAESAKCWVERLRGRAHNR